MLDLSRRRLLTGLIAAPILIKTPGLLMPIKALPVDRTLLTESPHLAGYTIRITAYREYGLTLVGESGPSVFLNDQPVALSEAQPVPQRSYQVRGLPMTKIDFPCKPHPDVVSFETVDLGLCRWPGFVGSIIDIGHEDIGPPGKFRVLKVEEIA